MTDSQWPPETHPETNRVTENQTAEHQATENQAGEHRTAPEELEPNRDPLGDRLVIIIVLMVLFMFLIATGFLFIVTQRR